MPPSVAEPVHQLIRVSDIRKATFVSEEKVVKEARKGLVGIPVPAGRDFFLAFENRIYALSNWVDLDAVETYGALKSAVKRVKLMLHPDKGGDPWEFQAFSKAASPLVDEFWSKVSDGLFLSRLERYKHLMEAARTLELNDAEAVKIWTDALENVVSKMITRRERAFINQKVETCIRNTSCGNM